MEFTPINYRAAGTPVKAMKNENNTPLDVEVNGETTIVPGGWTLLFWQNSGLSMMRNQDFDDTFKKDEELTTIEAFLNTTTDLRHSLQLLSSEVGAIHAGLESALARISVLEAPSA